MPSCAGFLMIERLTPPVADRDLRALGELLVDAVDSGAAVSFLAPLTLEHAEAWWRRTLGLACQRDFLVARENDGIVGTVQLHPAWAPNQPHRADVAKLIVHRRARRAGLGRRLMQSIEDAARQAGLHAADARRQGRGNCRAALSADRVDGGRHHPEVCRRHRRKDSTWHGDLLQGSRVGPRAVSGR